MLGHRTYSLQMTCGVLTQSVVAGPGSVPPRLGRLLRPGPALLSGHAVRSRPAAAHAVEPQDIGVLHPLARFERHWPDAAHMRQQIATIGAIPVPLVPDS